jgi:hypothetical protein
MASCAKSKNKVSGKEPDCIRRNKINQYSEKSIQKNREKAKFQISTLLHGFTADMHCAGAF